MSKYLLLSVSLIAFSLQAMEPKGEEGFQESGTTLEGELSRFDVDRDPLYGSTESREMEEDLRRKRKEAARVKAEKAARDEAEPEEREGRPPVRRKIGF